MFLIKGVLKICCKFTGEHPCRSVISIKLQSNFIEIKLRHGCSPVNLLHIFRTSFLKNTSGGLLLKLPKFSHVTYLQDKSGKFTSIKYPLTSDRLEVNVSKNRLTYLLIILQTSWRLQCGSKYVHHSANSDLYRE